MRVARRTTMRNGFTLLEVILASGLTVVLLTAVYQAVAMTYAQLEAGRQIAQDAQLARELARKIRSDFASAYTVYKPPSATPTGDTGSGTGGGTADSSGSGTSTGSSSSSSSSSSGGGSSSVGQTDYNPPPGGVMGTESALTVVTRVPPTDLDFSSTLTAENGYFPVSDLRIIRYRLGNGASPSDPSAGGDTGGLYREEIIRIPDTSSGADPLSSARVECLAEEVQSLQFRYYDGVEWLSVWDAEETSAPLAIEIRLSVVPPGLSPRQTQPTPRNYRWMVALPIAAAPASSSSASSSSGASSGSTGQTGAGAGAP